MNPKEFRLSEDQQERLDRIAAQNAISSSELVSLAVDALIREARRHQGRLPHFQIPKSALQTPFAQ